MVASAGFEPAECKSQSLVPYHLATRQQSSGGETWIRTMEPEGTDLQSAAFSHFAISPDCVKYILYTIIYNSFYKKAYYIKMVPKTGIEPVTY